MGVAMNGMNKNMTDASKGVKVDVSERRGLVANIQKTLVKYSQRKS